ncbi:MAG: 15-cis-phytoene synthase [Hyphomicrobiaceae bacterium hypho_1]
MPYLNPNSFEYLVKFSQERIEKGSKSFTAAARLFPQETRSSVYMLYAWCRHCDDIIDGQYLGHEDTYREVPIGIDAQAAVEALAYKTQRACAGYADEPVFRGLAAITEKHSIPEKYPLDLIAGFKMDTEGYRYVTINDTLKYCYHVAGVVGIIIAMIIGTKERVALERACDLGIGFQLTNIARDIVQDHMRNRIYIPQNWLEEAGLMQTSMIEPQNRVLLAKVVRRLLDTSEIYYQSAKCGLAHLPFRSAWAVGTALKVYRTIGLEVRRRGSHAWDKKISTNGITKFGGTVSGLTLALKSRSARKKAQE